jgi:iron complex transport system ATP-binding protein
MITHHVNLAARFADRIMVLDDGRTAAAGPPSEALQRAVLERVFRWPLHTLDWRGIPQLLPLKRSEQSETGNAAG